MNIERPAFTSTRLEEERAKDKGVVFSLRLNEEEYNRLKEACGWFDTDQNSTAVKILVEIGYNVLQHQFTPNTLNWLFKKDRVRGSDLRGKK